MNYIEFIGIAAGTCGILSFVPQVLKAYKTKKTRDLSWGLLILLTSSILLWLLYGILSLSPSIIYTNICIFVLLCILIYLKRKYK